MATHTRARSSAKELSAQQTSLWRLECRHTGQTRKAHLKAEFILCGHFPDNQGFLKHGLTLMAAQGCARPSAKERMAQQTSLGRLESRHTGQTCKAH